MKKHNVLLVCGSGASSGFMAANIRKAAAARGLSITVNARSESTVEDYVDEIDCLMIGPHLASTLPEMEEICEGYDVKVGVIEQAAYARLNGDAALDPWHVWRGLILYGTKQGSGPALNSAADHRQHK